MARRFLVRCTFEIEVTVNVENAEFDIEDNSCPGTHSVGAEVERIMDVSEEMGHCWACNLNGKNEIIREVTDEPEEFRFDKDGAICRTLQPWHPPLLSASHFGQRSSWKTGETCPACNWVT